MDYEPDDLEDFCFDDISLLNNYESCINDPSSCDNNILYLSAKFNIGVFKLRDYLLKIVGYVQNFQGTFSARQRHIHLLENDI